MLILQRKAGESLLIGGDIEVSVLSVDAGRVRLAIQAPKSVPILRSELKNAATANQEAAVEGASPLALLDALRAHVEGLGLELFTISAAAHQGTRELVQKTAQLLQELPPVAVYEPTYVERPPEVDTEGEVNIEEFDGTWVVDAPWLQRLIANVNFGDYESRNWFDQKLRQSGLFDKLEEMGIKDGDIVSMYDLEFEYQR